MRETAEEIITQFPLWEKRKDIIVAVRYADIPDREYTEKDHEFYKSLPEGTMRNVCFADEWIWLVNGDYQIYYPCCGKIYIHKATQKVMHGDINIHHRGKCYSVMLNLMYGYTILRVDKFLHDSGSGKSVGFCTKDSFGSTQYANHTEEMERDEILRILNDPMADFGYGVQKFLETAREVYKDNPENYYLKNCWGSGGKGK
jgi:hypothetical protein|nr:MAG TPA: hypothetical protein [Bacteriophage sp.]